MNPNTVQHALHQLEQEGLVSVQGTNGRFVTRDMDVLEALKTQRIRRLAEECAKQFAALGLSPAQAARELMGLERTDTNG